jgi:hypothetical protein
MGQMVAPWLAAVVALLSPAAAVMNAGGVPYKVGNAGPEYSTEFADESPEYFDSYSEVQTRYSQVFWTRSPNIPLPADIVERFAGKVMVITGYEVDQVMNPHVVNGTCLTTLLSPFIMPTTTIILGGFSETTVRCMISMSPCQG